MKEKKHVLSSIILIFTSLIMIVPFILMIITSFKSMKEILSPSFIFFPDKILFSNYTEALKMGEWGTYFFNTLYVTAITTVVSVFTNSIAGYSFARLDFKGKDTMFIVSLLGMMIPPQVTMIPVFLIEKHIPFAGGNNFLGQGGLGWLNSYMGLIAPYIAGSFQVFLFRQFYITFPKSLDDAASIDGLNKFLTYFKIYVPLSMPVVTTATVLKITQSWNEYTWPLILTMSEDMKTVQLALTMFKSDIQTRWDMLMAATTLIMLPLVVIFIFAQKYFVEGIVTTGVKN